MSTTHRLMRTNTDTWHNGSVPSAGFRTRGGGTRSLLTPSARDGL